MGIRYYAYAFDAELSEFAETDPAAFVGADPLADAWGIAPGSGVASFVPQLSEADFLYLDKAWSYLQRITVPPRYGDGRPCHRMFEGRVRETDRGHHAWYRAVLPHETKAIARDLEVLARDVGWGLSDRDDAYVREFLGRAVRFVDQIALAGRGFVYTIG